MTNVFNILSSQTNIDFPICQDCCNILINRLKKKAVFHNLSEKENLKKEEERLLDQLLRLEMTDDDLDGELVRLQEKKVQLENEKLQKTGVIRI
ncbi:CRB_1a_G0054880.mRNA.1.CDS.1 [Saccharomyces cerevisiae]|nr:CRB_1a_G0054880.mRNA.1.CDS.1 [Saccharomyces cerevisiae]CAI7480446.1 CRB_1a_G0054880.mRNA.1.CDS.1 [Saccharomyces cerevisiae]